MTGQRVAVLGAGVAGLSAAIMLARDGHRVTLVERDDLVDGEAMSAEAWPRTGIPHFLQPHAFIPRGLAELRRRFSGATATRSDLGAGGACGA
jgi:phytoene dehydrogenase-like protein